MAIAQITAVLKAHCSTGIARYTGTMLPGHNLEYCLEETRFEKHFNRSIRTCRVTGQKSGQDVNTWSLSALVIGFFFFFSLSLSVTDQRQQVLTRQAVSKTSACMKSKTAVYKVVQQFILNFHRLPSVFMRRPVREVQTCTFSHFRFERHE